jgi:hypothetical protein
MTFGNPIMPDELDSYTNSRELASFLKGKVYDLANRYGVSKK